MLYKYTNKNSTKKYPKPKLNNNKMFNRPTWILNGSAPEQNVMSRGSTFLQKYKSSEILEYYLDFIEMVSFDPQIIVISGVSHTEFLKHKRSYEYAIIENQLFRLTNSAEDLRLGVFGSRQSADTFFIDLPIIPNIDWFTQVKYNSKSKILCHSDNNSKKIGAEVNNDNFVKFTFNNDTKLSGIYYFNEIDLIKIKRKLMTNIFGKNKFAFELLSDIKFKIIMENNDNTN